MPKSNVTPPVREGRSSAVRDADGPEETYGLQKTVANPLGGQPWLFDTGATVNIVSKPYLDKVRKLGEQQTVELGDNTPLLVRTEEWNGCLAPFNSLHSDPSRDSLVTERVHLRFPAWDCEAPFWVVDVSANPLVVGYPTQRRWGLISPTAVMPSGVAIHYGTHSGQSSTVSQETDLQVGSCCAYRRGW